MNHPVCLSLRPYTKDVENYYSHTTFRDYKLLEFATGCNAMHTDLVPLQKVPFGCKHLKQLLYVMMHMGDDSVPGPDNNILEVGFGKVGLRNRPRMVDKG